MELEQVKFKYLGNVFNLKNEAGKRKQMENKMNKIETQTCKHKSCNHVFLSKIPNSESRNGRSFGNVGDGAGTATIGPERAMFGFNSSETLFMQTFSVVFF